MGDAYFFIAIVFIIGVVFVIVGRSNRRRVDRLRRVGRKTVAEVVGHQHRRSQDGGSTPYPIVQFRAPDGRLVTADTDFGGTFAPGIGEQVEILFDPARPEEVHLDNPTSDKVVRLFEVLGWIMLGGACVGVVVTALIAWL
jgi:hypothetical protein